MDLKENLMQVEENICKACKNAGREQDKAGFHAAGGL